MYVVVMMYIGIVQSPNHAASVEEAVKILFSLLVIVACGLAAIVFKRVYKRTKTN